MFVRQAAQQFQYFTGKEAPVDYMAETLRRSISAARAVSGTGEASPQNDAPAT